MTNRTQLQIDFEASCFMHEVDASNELRESVRKYNNSEPLNKEQKINLAKSIWRL